MNQARGDRSYLWEEVSAVSNQLGPVAAGRLMDWREVGARITDHKQRRQLKEKKKGAAGRSDRQDQTCMKTHRDSHSSTLTSQQRLVISQEEKSKRDRCPVWSHDFVTVPSSEVLAVLDSLSMPWNSLKNGRTLISYTMPFFRLARTTLRSDATFTSCVCQAPGAGRPEVCRYTTL